MGIRSELVRRYVVAMVVLASAVVLAACGSDSSDGGDSGSRADLSLYTDVPASGCGSQPGTVVSDPDGVIAELPKAHQGPYKGLSFPTVKSAWSDFKAKDGPPYTIGLNQVPSINPYMSAINDSFASSVKASTQVGKVISKFAQGPNDVVGQLANFDAILRQKPDVIVTIAIQPAPFKAAIDRAAKQGVPVVAILNPVDTKNAVNVGYNIYESIAHSTATMMRLIDGKGNVMWVNGIPGDAATDFGLKAYKDTIKRCPEVKDIGQAFGTYTNSVAKREMLSFLATHPQKFAAVGQAASMAPGIMQAFQQSGRPIPIVQDSAAQQGSLGYWRQHPSYRGTGFGVPPAPTARTAVNVALRILEGQGPKLNNIMNLAPAITPTNLDDWAEPGWTLSSNGAVNGPEKDLMTNDYLNPMFNNGAPPK